jgi:hypothetical protein
MTEEEFKANVIELARTLGWRIHHDRPARLIDGEWRTAIEGDAGFPDLVLARKGRLIIAELKAENGKLTGDQKQWIHEMANTTRPVIQVWKPSAIQHIAHLLGPKGKNP